MYHRVKGAVFTVKNPDEKKEIIDVINKNYSIKTVFKCVGLDVQQFTGKINSAVLKMLETNQVISFMVSGNFPTMTLSNPLSNNTYVVEFPTEEQIIPKVVKHVHRKPIREEKKEEKIEVKEETAVVNDVMVVKIDPPKEDEPVIIPSVFSIEDNDTKVETPTVSTSAEQYILNVEREEEKEVFSETHDVNEEENKVEEQPKMTVSARRKRKKN